MLKKTARCGIIEVMGNTPKKITVTMGGREPTTLLPHGITKNIEADLPLLLKGLTHIQKPQAENG